MPLAKSKPGRGPLQRLNDQRRSVALAGLAAGAVGAAFFRRSRRGGGDGLESSPMPVAAGPEPVLPVVSPESGPPPAVEVPAPASEPEIEVESRSSSSIAEPTTGELSAEEASILAVLAQSGRKDGDRTAIAVATALERDTADVTAVLLKLDSEGVVSGEPQTSEGEEIWAVTERGVRRLGAQH